MLKLNLLEKIESPLQRWIEIVKYFSKLSREPGKYLSSPPSSIENESLFNIFGNINSKKAFEAAPEEWRNADVSQL